MAAAVARTGTWTMEIVHRRDRHRFVVLPKRWMAERTLAWVSRCRRRARDYERHMRKATAFIRLAMIRLMLQRLAASSSDQIRTSRKGSHETVLGLARGAAPAGLADHAEDHGAQTDAELTCATDRPIGADQRKRHDPTKFSEEAVPLMACSVISSPQRRSPSLCTHILRSCLGRRP